jgi:hypothetical protein
MRDFYQVGALLNCGLSAEVYEAVSKVDGRQVALKIYFLSDRAAVHEAITEHVCMTRAQSEHVLRCYGIMFDGKRPGLVLERASHSLRDFLQVRVHSAIRTSHVPQLRMHTAAPCT